MTKGIPEKEAKKKHCPLKQDVLDTCVGSECMLWVDTTQGGSIYITTQLTRKGKKKFNEDGMKNLSRGDFKWPSYEYMDYEFDRPEAKYKDDSVKAHSCVGKWKNPYSAINTGYCGLMNKENA